MADDHQMMWLEDEEEAEQGQAQAPQQLEGPDTELVSSRTPAEAESAIAQLEAELQRTKKELQDVRKDLAAKVRLVQAAKLALCPPHRGTWAVRSPLT